MPPKNKISKTDKPLIWKELFLEFISNLSIESKDYGNIPLKNNLYGAQFRYLEEICDGLEKGVRHFVILKARQLGISTISLAVDLFWMASHPGMQGALITDTEGNKEKFRVIIDQYLKSLPRELKIRYNGNNRNMLVFSNGSVLDYLVAGVKSKGGSLGRSRAYNFIHATECSSWGDENGVASLMASLSSVHKDRLYIFESTARGFNLFYNMWESANNDPETQKPIFIGWWAKDSYTAKMNTDIYKKYWESSPNLNPDEQEKADIAESRYALKITSEQWAWYRWQSATRMQSDGTMESEYPTHEVEAFVATGKGFFPVKQVSADKMNILNDPVPVKLLQYKMAEEFWKTEIESGSDWAKGELKIYEDPSDHGTYVFGVDPAYGRDEENDRSVIQIFRCYADKLVQVAEYATPVVETHHLAWVLCHLAGLYRDCRINLELQGPGYAVMQEMEHLKMMLKNGYLDRQFVAKAGLKDFMPKAKWYLYHRPDSMGAGFIYNWKTNSENKQTIFNQMRDLYLTKQLQIKSLALFDEMLTLVQDGFEIRGSGANHDDRCMAAALACKAYIEWVRQPMINQKMTEEHVRQIEQNAQKPYQGFVRSIYDDWMQRQKAQRSEQMLIEDWAEDGVDFSSEVGYDTSFDGEDMYE